MSLIIEKDGNSYWGRFIYHGIKIGFDKAKMTGNDLALFDQGKIIAMVDISKLETTLNREAIITLLSIALEPPIGSDLYK